MENVCHAMDKYQLEISEDGAPEGTRWILSSQATSNAANGNAELNAHLVKEQRRVLRNACADIIGQWEDDLAHSIREGEASAESIKEVLCMKLGGYCKPEPPAGRYTDEL